MCVPIDGDVAAFVGDNRRLLVVDLTEIPDMARGRGVILQRYRSGGLDRRQGLPPRRRSLLAPGRKPHPHRMDLTPWRGTRGGAGHSVPQGFPRSGKFG